MKKISKDLTAFVTVLLYFFHLHNLLSHSCCLFCCFRVSLFWCNRTYVGNKVGIYFSVSRSCCVSSQRPMPSWPTLLIKKPLLALVSLSKSPSPHLCEPEHVCACLSIHVGWIGITETGRKICSRPLLLQCLYLHILDHNYAQMFSLIKFCLLVHAYG